MTISVTIQVESFDELFKVLRSLDAPVVRTTVEAEQIELPLHAEASEAVNPNPPLVDKTGSVWNAEIHASSKALNADGTWRRKRGITKDEPPAPVATQPVPQVVAPVATQVVMPPVQQPVTVDYNTLMHLIGQKMQTGVLTGAALGAMQVEYGLSNFNELIPRPDLIAAIYARVSAL